jgi:hypothetical protein
MIANTLHREILYALVPENVGQRRSSLQLWLTMTLLLAGGESHER